MSIKQLFSWKIHRRYSVQHSTVFDLRESLNSKIENFWLDWIIEVPISEFFPTKCLRLSNKMPSWAEYFLSSLTGRSDQDTESTVWSMSRRSSDTLYSIFNSWDSHTIIAVKIASWTWFSTASTTLSTSLLTLSLILFFEDLLNETLSAEWTYEQHKVEYWPVIMKRFPKTSVWTIFDLALLLHLVMFVKISYSDLSLTYIQNLSTFSLYLLHCY